LSEDFGGGGGVGLLLVEVGGVLVNVGVDYEGAAVEVVGGLRAFEKAFLDPSGVEHILRHSAILPSLRLGPAFFTILFVPLLVKKPTCLHFLAPFSRLLLLVFFDHLLLLLALSFLLLLELDFLLLQNLLFLPILLLLLFLYFVGLDSALEIQVLFLILF
jgi:hypothetical protein